MKSSVTDSISIQALHAIRAREERASQHLVRYEAAVTLHIQGINLERAYREDRCSIIQAEEEYYGYNKHHVDSKKPTGDSEKSQARQQMAMLAEEGYEPAEGWLNKNYPPSPECRIS